MRGAGVALEVHVVVRVPKLRDQVVQCLIEPSVLQNRVHGPPYSLLDRFPRETNTGERQNRRMIPDTALKQPCEIPRIDHKVLPKVFDVLPTNQHRAHLDKRHPLVSTHFVWNNGLAAINGHNKSNRRRYAYVQVAR